MAVVLYFAYPMPLTAIQKVGMVDKSLGNVIYSVLIYHVSCFVFEATVLYFRMSLTKYYNPIEFV